MKGKFFIPKLLFLLGLLFLIACIAAVGIGFAQGASGANIGAGLLFILAISLWLVALIGLLYVKPKTNRIFIILPILLLGWVLFGPLLSTPFYILFPPAGSCPFDFKYCPGTKSHIGRVPPSCEFELCPEENLKVYGSFKENVTSDEIRMFGKLFPKARVDHHIFTMDKVLLSQCKNIEATIVSLKYIESFNKCHY